jgi:hypothetical protein
MFRVTRLAVAALACLGLLALVSSSQAAALAPKYPRMHESLYELKEVRTQLKEAGHDFGGHRVKALAAVDEAVVQIERALNAVGDSYGGFKVDPERYRTYPNHPHIRHALAILRDTRVELKEAAHDFKGHREKALEAVNYAIEQLELALKFAK